MILIPLDMRRCIVDLVVLSASAISWSDILREARHIRGIEHSGGSCFIMLNRSLVLGSAILSMIACGTYSVFIVSRLTDFSCKSLYLLHLRHNGFPHTPFPWDVQHLLMITPPYYDAFTPFIVADNIL
jgi:hypothetical protein